MGVPYKQVLSIWFGQFDELGMSDALHSGRWWKKDESFDAALRERFAATHAEIVAGQRSDWLETTRGKLAAVLVLDQFSRNMFRGTPKMYATDSLALGIAVNVIDRGEELNMWVDERAFFYLPLMHSEKLEHQNRCVSLFTAFREELAGAPRKRVDANVWAAIKHQSIVERFGRFPHRNEILGRESTAEELAFLQEPGSSF